MAALAPSRDLTAAYESALSTATTQAVIAVRRATRGLTYKTFGGEWPAAAVRATNAIKAGQASATALASWYLQESVRTTLHVPSPPPQIEPTVGLMLSGQTVAQYVARSSDVVEARIAGGMKPDAAVDMSMRRIASVAATEPFRLGRSIVAEIAIADKNYSGWQRIAEAGACDFCAALATRGDAYTSKSSAESTSVDLAYHNNCRCYAEPVLAADAPALRALGEQQWAQTESRPSFYRTGSRSGGKSRGPSGPSDFFRKALDFRPGAGTAERAASARLQIDQLEQRIAELQLRHDAGDAAVGTPLEWSRARLADLRAELAN